MSRIKWIAKILISKTLYHTRPGSGIPKRVWVEFIQILHSTDVVYIIGGTPDKSKPLTQNYKVIGVNIATGEVFAPQELTHTVTSSAAAASLNRLAICGGFEQPRLCNVYSPKNDRYAQIAICEYSLLPKNVFFVLFNLGLVYLGSLYHTNT